MEITTFDDDLLELKGFADRLEKFIDVEHDYVEGSLVIALSSKFGSGKSSFLRMWSNSLASKSEEEKPIVVFLNAWESDYFGDPLFAIISALADRLKEEGEPTDKLLTAAKDFGWFATAVGGQIVKKVTGVDAIAAGDLAEKKKAQRKEQIRILNDTFSIYEGRKQAMVVLKSAIQDYIEANRPKILFFVDELDRCRPDYAISYLETIKHIFDIKGAIFILAADRKQLENSAKAAFGSDLDFDEYYRKFIHREVTLPAISKVGYSRLSSTYVKVYLEREGKRSCSMPLDGYRVEEITVLITVLKLTPRQIQEVFRMLGHVFSTTEANRGRLLWCLAVGTIFMAAIKIGNPRIFRLLGHQELEPQEAYDFLRSLLGDESIEWWFILLLTGEGLKRRKEERFEVIMKSVGLWKDDDRLDKQKDLSDWYHGWGRSSNRFVQIHEIIEQISGWD